MHQSYDVIEAGTALPTNQPHNFTCKNRKKNRCQALPKSSHCKWQKSWQV